MTPKEKANELIEKYSNVEIQIGGQYDGYLYMQIHDAKQCALIAQKNLLEKLQSLNITDEFEENVLLEINVL
jgi:hypothetical protein